jgi:exonuclease SbcD
VFAPPRYGGIVEVASRSGRETALVACLPFLSQRYVVRADDLMSDDASDHTQQYAQRMRRLIEVLAAEFRDDTVNVLAAHCMVDGATVAGSERTAHTIFEYAVPATAFPSTAHYVALGHLHRQQLVNGPCPIRYSGSLLQLDFGEVDDAKGALLVEAAAGGGPAQVTPLPFSGGRRLRRVSGTMADLRTIAETIDDAYVKVTIEEPWRAGLADETRDLFPDAVEIVVARPASDADRAPRATRTGRPARELFAEYLAERDVDEPRLLALFDELQEAAT